MNLGKVAQYRSETLQKLQAVVTPGTNLGDEFREGAIQALLTVAVVAHLSRRDILPEMKLIETVIEDADDAITSSINRVFLNRN